MPSRLVPSQSSVNQLLFGLLTILSPQTEYLIHDPVLKEAQEELHDNVPVSYPKSVQLIPSRSLPSQVSFSQLLFGASIVSSPQIGGVVTVIVVCASLSDSSFSTYKRFALIRSVVKVISQVKSLAIFTWTSKELFSSVHNKGRE